ncbi:uncharacterized protein LOC125776614 [Bactrocera dorsalis]|uniref:Uncharacterized protein LOC125776614 n=1 Tax=Bactrocera dorsalis TaxID=27457 RepID=A0ABM3J9K6_BACDO|nr:uncharacterized protein LOC125776614 [Bactrocera dorsalis]
MENQIKLAEELQKLHFKSMSMDINEDLENLEKLLDSLAKKWSEFQRNHLELSKDPKNKKDNYFKSDVEGSVGTLYLTAHAKLSDLIAIIKENSAPRKMECLPNPGLVRRLQFLLTELEKNIEDCELNEICSLDSIERLIEKTRDTVLEFISQHENDELTSKFYDLRNRFYKLKLKSISKKNATNFTLPQVDIPIFSGDYAQWQTFKELFEQLVVSQNVSNTYKMCILKTKLRGSAASCITNLPSTSTNFSVAWNLLNEKFTNKRLLANTYFKQILEAPVVTETAFSVRKFQEKISESTQALESLSLSADNLLQALLNYTLVQKLDNNLRLRYENSLKNPKEIPTLNSLQSFLIHEGNALEAAQASKTSPKFQNAEFKCIMGCNNSHNIFYCHKFKALSTQDKWDAVIKHKLCTKCLKTGHNIKECKGESCLTCKGNHHLWLHKDKTSKAKSTIIKNTKNDKLKNDSKHVLLTTAIVGIKGRDGRIIKARALLDSGSQVHLITKELKNKLKLPSKRESMTIEGVGQNKTNTNERVNLHLKSLKDPFETNLDTMVVEKIVSNVPTEHIKVKKIPENIKLADPSFGVPGKIDLLLGADIFFDFLKEEKLSIENVNYKLQNSVFGWLIYGSTNISSKLAHCGVVTYFDEKLDNQLKKFWEIESIENKCVNQTKEETHCEEHFINNFKISVDGKFTVALPFKKENINLGDSSLQAKRRFLSLEKKLKNNEIVREQYKQFMKEYIRLGHTEEIKNVNLFKSKYYLPHHCVLKPDSTTTKLIVVFDASCKTDKNVSLNSIMHSGPKLQENLFNILLRFRKHM